MHEWSRLGRRLWLMGVSCCLIGLAGCEPISGILGGKLASQSPNEHCILDALRKTPKIFDVQVKAATYEGWSILGDGPHHGSSILYFTYHVDGSRYSPVLMAEEHANGRFEYSNTMLIMDWSMPQSDIDAALPGMLAAEKQVSQLCGINLDTGMKHTCNGVACGP